MGPFTVFTTSADLTLLTAIFNGVAMICSQTAFIWGFAMLASSWKIASSVASTAVRSTGGIGGAALASGSMATVMPLILAMLLTLPGLQSRVLVESTINGSTIPIDNVPVVISILPAAGSELSLEVGQLVSTAFSMVGTDYGSLSSSTNGFVNPLKALLTTRSAMVKLGGIDSQVKAVMSACLGSESGVSYSQINTLVMHASNSGATAAQTIAINGSTGTALGALLFQASLNTTGVVPDLSAPGTVTTCSDAAIAVAGNIGAAINAPEFSRVLQGAVNGMDQPIVATPPTITSLNAQYTALRTANTTTITLVGGAAQAQTEMLNLMFSEMVSSNLNCLQAESSDKASCQALMVQQSEIERTNLMNAAGELPMFKFAGSLGNYMLALIIGLGPIIVMFMMFLGAEVGKSLAIATHIVLWPLLVMNVGAELVNGMICITIADFLASLSSGGFLTHALAFDAYKQFSLQIGTASHIMASLPVVMSTIFALGGASALAGMTKGGAANGSTTSSEAAPNQSDMIAKERMATAEMTPSGAAVVSHRGAVGAASAEVQQGSFSTEQTRGLNEAIAKQRTVSEGETNLASWQQAFDKRDYSSLGFSFKEGEAIRTAYENNLRESHATGKGATASGTTSNYNNSGANLHASGSVSGGGGGGGGGGASAGVSGGGSIKTETGATDQLSLSTHSTKDDKIDRSKALTKALTKDTDFHKNRGSGSDQAKTIRKTLDAQTSYQTLASESSSSTTSSSETDKASDSILMATQKIGAAQIAHQMTSNPSFGMYHLLEGKKFEADPETQKYRALAEKEMDSGASDTIIGDPKAKNAAINLRAATMMARDKNASAKGQTNAMNFAVGSANAMLHSTYTPGNTESLGVKVGTPVDRTGVNKKELTDKGNTQEKAPLPQVRQPASMKKEGKQVEADSTPNPEGTTQEANRLFRQAEGAGLGPGGDGTILRTGKNVYANATGDTSRTKDNGPEQDGPPRPPAPPTRSLVAPETDLDPALSDMPLPPELAHYPTTGTKP